MSNLLLIEPPFYRLYEGGYSLDKYPLALGYLSSYVLKHSHWNVQVYNADFYAGDTQRFSPSFLARSGYKNYLENLKNLNCSLWGEIALAIKEFSPNVVGISCKTQNFASVRIIAEIAKRNNPNTIVVVGGPHPTMQGKEVLECPWIDVSVQGEGEETLVDLLESIDADVGFKSVAGVCYRDSRGIVCKNSPRGYIQDLDLLPFPYSSAPIVLKDYLLYPDHAFQYVLSMRGCPFSCEFCGSRKIWSRKVRYRSIENVIEEMRALRKIGLKHIHFDDDTFGANCIYFQDLCNAILADCNGLTWSCETVVSLINESSAQLMKKSGCTRVQIGVESGNDLVLSKIKKNITIGEAFKAVDVLKNNQLRVDAFFMAGFPCETEGTLMDTYRAIMEINADEIIFSIFTPYPGTDIFEYCKRVGLLDDGYDASLYNHQSPANCFTANMSKKRFREIVSSIEDYLDQRRLNSA